jgi:hypothetical protein
VTGESVAQRLDLTAGLQGDEAPITASWVRRADLPLRRRGRALRTQIGTTLPLTLPVLFLPPIAFCGRRQVREGHTKLPYGSMGRFFPHLAHKTLKSFFSVSNSSESGLFNGLQRIQIENSPPPLSLCAKACRARKLRKPVPFPVSRPGGFRLIWSMVFYSTSFGFCQAIVWPLSPGARVAGQTGSPRDEAGQARQPRRTIWSHASPQPLVSKAVLLAKENFGQSIGNSTYCQVLLVA